MEREGGKRGGMVGGKRRREEGGLVGGKRRREGENADRRVGINVV